MPVAMVLSDLALASQSFWLATSTERAAAIGAIMDDQAAAWLAQLEESDRQGRFSAGSPATSWLAGSSSRPSRPPIGDRQHIVYAAASDDPRSVNGLSRLPRARAGPGGGQRTRLRERCPQVLVGEGEGRGVGFGGVGRLEGLVAADVTRFVQGECRDGHVRGAKIVVSALRSLLHYLHLEGRTARQLASVVPAVAGWRGSSLPQGLEPEQVACLLASCDRRMAAVAATTRSCRCWCAWAFAPRRWPPWTSKTSIGERARWWCAAKDIARSDCRCPSMSARRLSTTSARVGLPAGARGCSYGSGLPITS